MEAQLTFGEYMRRLRRSRKWNLNALAEATASPTPIFRVSKTIPRCPVLIRWLGWLNPSMVI